MQQDVLRMLWSLRIMRLQRNWAHPQDSVPRVRRRGETE